MRDLPAWVPQRWVERRWRTVETLLAGAVVVSFVATDVLGFSSLGWTAFALAGLLLVVTLLAHAGYVAVAALRPNRSTGPRRGLLHKGLRVLETGCALAFAGSVAFAYLTPPSRSNLPPPEVYVAVLALLVGALVVLLRVWSTRWVPRGTGNEG